HEISVAIANIFLGLKRQHVLPLKEDFERTKAAYADHQIMIKSGGPLAPFHFTADMRSLNLPATPQVALEKMIFEKTLIRGRALAGLVALVGAIDGLSLSVKARNEMVENRRNAQWNDQERLEFFLGLRTAAGVIHERFPTNIAAIIEQTDHCIFFAKT